MIFVFNVSLMLLFIVRMFYPCDAKARDVSKGFNIYDILLTQNVCSEVL